MASASDRCASLVIGAGMAGAACARALADRGLAVTLVRQGPLGRRPDGAAAGRSRGVRPRRPVSERPRPGFPARGGGAGGRRASSPTGRGARAARGVPVLVGVPAMNAPVKALLGRPAGATACRVAKLAPSLPAAGRLAARTARRHGPFARRGAGRPGTAGGGAPGHGGPGRATALLLRLGGVRMAPCWSALAAFAGRSLEPRRRCARRTVRWPGRRATRASPGRGDGETWTLHAAPGLVAERAGAATRRRWRRRCWPASRRLLGRRLPEPTYLAAHRWRYALVERPLGEPCLWDAGAAARPVRRLVPRAAGRGRLPVRPGAGDRGRPLAKPGRAR